MSLKIRSDGVGLDLHRLEFAFTQNIAIASRHDQRVKIDEQVTNPGERPFLGGESQRSQFQSLDLLADACGLRCKPVRRNQTRRIVAGAVGALACRQPLHRARHRLLLLGEHAHAHEFADVAWDSNHI